MPKIREFLSQTSPIFSCSSPQPIDRPFAPSSIDASSTH